MTKLPKPLPKALYEELKSLRAILLHVHLSGGSDVGHVHLYAETQDQTHIYEFNFDTEGWALGGYNGAGDGSAYGDDIVYDLVNNTVTHSDWYMERQDGASESSEKIEVEGCAE